MIGRPVAAVSALPSSLITGPRCVCRPAAKRGGVLHIPTVQDMNGERTQLPLSPLSCGDLGGHRASLCSVECQAYIDAIYVDAASGEQRAPPAGNTALHGKQPPDGPGSRTAEATPPVLVLRQRAPAVLAAGQAKSSARGVSAQTAGSCVGEAPSLIEAASVFIGELEQAILQFGRQHRRQTEVVDLT